MVKGEKIEFDLERTSLQIKTIQGGVGVSLFLYDENDKIAGKIFLKYLTSLSSSHSAPTYEIYDCILKRNFNDEVVLPIDRDNVWTITKTYPGPRITVQCNEVTVVDVTMSDQACAGQETRWEPTWSKDVAKIKFSLNSDTASKYYRPKPPPGNKELTNSFCFNQKRITKKTRLVLGRLGN